MGSISKAFNSLNNIKGLVTWANYHNSLFDNTTSEFEGVVLKPNPGQNMACYLYPYSTNSIHSVEATLKNITYSYNNSGRFMSLQFTSPSNPGYYIVSKLIANQNTNEVKAEIGVNTGSGETILASSIFMPSTNNTLMDWVKQFHTYKLTYDLNTCNFYIDNNLIVSANLSVSFPTYLPLIYADTLSTWILKKYVIDNSIVNDFSNILDCLIGSVDNVSYYWDYNTVNNAFQVANLTAYHAGILVPILLNIHNVKISVVTYESSTISGGALFITPGIFCNSGLDGSAWYQYEAGYYGSDGNNLLIIGKVLNGSGVTISSTPTATNTNFNTLEFGGNPTALQAKLYHANGNTYITSVVNNDFVKYGFFGFFARSTALVRQVTLSSDNNIPPNNVNIKSIYNNGILYSTFSNPDSNVKMVDIEFSTDGINFTDRKRYFTWHRKDIPITDMVYNKAVPTGIYYIKVTQMNEDFNTNTQTFTVNTAGDTNSKKTRRGRR